MLQNKTYYLILDVTNGRLIGGNYIREKARESAIKICNHGEFWLIIETTDNMKDLEVWTAIYPAVHS
jgi:hypothetical protein